MEKFDYDPGMETFPDVYIRDPKVGVQYELEDMEDVKEGTMLSLNIERESLVLCMNTNVSQRLIKSSSTLITLSAISCKSSRR
jgi:hypothetical protein